MPATSTTALGALFPVRNDVPGGHAELFRQPACPSNGCRLIAPDSAFSFAKRGISLILQTSSPSFGPTREDEKNYTLSNVSPGSARSPFVISIQAYPNPLLQGANKNHGCGSPQSLAPALPARSGIKGSHTSPVGTTESQGLSKLRG